MKTIYDAKKKVLEISKKAFSEKLFAGTSGNLSIYVREENSVVITPSSVRYEDMTLEDIIVIDFEGNKLEKNKYNPSSEYKLHCEIYRHKSDVNSVIHTHSPYATSFAVVNKSIPLILIEMIPFLGGDVPVTKLQIPGTKEVGISAVKALKDRNCCLLGNHGVVTVGDDIESAYLRAEYVEDAAKICTLAKSNGNIVLIPKDMENIMKN